MISKIESKWSLEELFSSQICWMTIYNRKGLLRDTIDTEKAPNIAVNMAMGHQNKQRIPSNNNNVNSNIISAIHHSVGFGCANVRKNQSSRNTFNRSAILLCRGCCQSWTSTHRQVCPAMGMKCNYFGLLNHFAKVCRKKWNKSKNSWQDTRINNVENSESKEQPESQNLNFIIYNEQHNSENESSDYN